MNMSKANEIEYVLYKLLFMSETNEQSYAQIFHELSE